ncbi:hypothetical protein HCN44_005432 [Aphidius gifuensis]|uniref:Ataxin-10 n=1 Tax=Aphidius gifuensis TaxID=684658 RepID=A0A834Y0N6_APHGI|nr:ataxin-10 [Aphidius gifuensis]KAF7997155.1 hypothetical protein HCN44_005432 [Aphidius gifuensis]
MQVYERLSCYSTREDWKNLTNLLQEENIIKNENGVINRQMLAKLAELLTRRNISLPMDLMMLILKCFMDSCDKLLNKPQQLNAINENIQVNCWNDLYKSISEDDKFWIDNKNLCDNYFPYEGVGQWVIDYLTNNLSKINDEYLKFIKRCICLLCNIICVSPQYDLPKFIQSINFNSTILKLLEIDDKLVRHPLCALIHNIIYNSKETIFNDSELKLIIADLIEDNTININPAYDSIMFLVKTSPKFLSIVYNDLSDDRKLNLLEMIHQNLKDIVYDNNNDNDKTTVITNEGIIFLKERFKRRSDLILKTEKSYLDGMEPTEVTMLLDILALISSNEQYNEIVLQIDTSLLINALYLLRAFHAAGKKDEENNFTPLLKLNDIAPNSSNRTTDPEKHPAFGFKAGLVRLIGNLVHKHKKNQDTVRENDGIALLLDCCNIDARNPLILQWTIIAIRNLCQNNFDNQKIIQDSSKIKTIDSSVLQSMGRILDGDPQTGKTIGVVQLPKKE